MSAELKSHTTESASGISQHCRFLSERSSQPLVAVEGTTHVVVYLNPAFATLVGRERQYLIGRPFAEAVPEGEANGCVALLDRVFRSGTPGNLAEQEHRQTNPEPVYWSYSMWPILGADDQPSGVMIQVTDSSEMALFRRQAIAMNEALVIAATRQHEVADVAEALSARLQTAVQSRDHFIAVMSHELRNPLAALNTGLQLLKHVGDNPAKSKDPSDLMGMMERQLNQLMCLVDDLLDVSRIASGKLELRKERVELASVVKDAVEASRSSIEGGRHELTLTLPPEPVMLAADPTRLGQVFQNLLNNAAKYSEPGGRIQLSARRDGDEVVISVRDTGIGIPAARLSHVFDVFVQVDTDWERVQGGLGIGLSLVKQFVGLHGGRVEAHSEGLGKGSEFIVRLPASIELDAPEPPSVATERARAPRRRILVVDDNTDAAESLARYLRFMGHEVQTADGGESAVALAAEIRPEVILLDIGMPIVDGYEAARRIRAGTGANDAFIVALTGWGAEDDRRRTHDAGFDRHLVKPVNPDAITAMIAEMAIKSS